MSRFNWQQLQSCFIPHGFVYMFLIVVCVTLLVLTIVFGNLSQKSNVPTEIYAVEKGIIGYPVRLPNDGRYVQWTFLHTNDVYEILPLDNGQKGGLARVAYLRKLLKQENSNTFTILAGDFVSPSALNSATVNGTALNGKHMVATLNTLGLDLTIFGNHEFDLSEKDLLARMNESTFTWINTNVFRRNTSQLFGPTVSHKIITIDTVRVLFIGLTIDSNQGYVQIINQSSLITYVQNYISQLNNNSYDILVAITHLPITMDIALTEKIPQIDLILGGHDHENFYFLRGDQYTPIYKADANAFTVYILRCAFNIDTKQFRIYPTLSKVTSIIPDEVKTAAVANYWFNLGMDGFRKLGFQPEAVVSCLPNGIELDGRMQFVRTTSTLLTDLICKSMINVTQSSQTIIGAFNSGSIRIDDILRQTVTQYDILRVLPFTNYILSISVPGRLLAQILSNSFSIAGSGQFLSYVGVQTFDNGETWFVNGTDVSISGLNYSIATIEYAKNTIFNNANITILQRTNLTQTKALIDYLQLIYPPC